MDVIKKSDMADSYWRDGYSGNEIIDMIRYKEIPTIKAIPIDKLHEMYDEIKCLNGLYEQEEYGTYKYDKYVKVDEVTKIINKYIEKENR
jgi:hypothetical protein